MRLAWQEGEEKEERRKKKEARKMRGKMEKQKEVNGGHNVGSQPVTQNTHYKMWCYGSI